MVGLTLGIVTMATVATSTLFPVSFAQEDPTILYLDPLPSSVNAGDTVFFSGYLITADGYAVQNAVIHINDDVSFGLDEALGTVVTDADGEFYGTWVAQARDGGGAYDFYAAFEGSDGFDSARSATYGVTVFGYASGGQAQDYQYTEIILYALPPLVYTDQTVMFTGQLTSNGYGIAGAEVNIMEDDPLVPDQVLARGYTDQNGEFVIPWDVDGGYLEVDFDVYAKFDGDGTYGHARSYNQVISVLRYGGSISLDPINPSAMAGELVEFSGTLKLDGGSPEGAVVYIKDEDRLSGDELLAVAYVDGGGRFSAHWLADYTDFDNTVDIYAVFEGDEDFARLTTCDAGPTMPVGGACLHTIPLTVHGTFLPPAAPDGGGTGGGYIELFYAMNLFSNPKVAIIPSPDSYDKVKSHIIPVQEGILMWTSAMEDRHGGNWDIDFEVVNPDDRFESKPDVAVMLVTPERHEKCDRGTLGWADLGRSTPTDIVQTYVCSSSSNKKYSNEYVAGTAAHEFIHAVGLGHAFNIAGDLMCSVEATVSTCPSNAKESNTPSISDLDAVEAIYGSDGFQNPNNRFAYGHKFYAEYEAGAAGETGPAPAPPDPPAVETDAAGFREFKTPEFSIRYPSDWDVDDEAVDLGANPGAWGSATSLVEFYDEAGGTILEVAFYEEDNNAINNKGEAYLGMLEDRLHQECLQVSYEYEGFECSNYSSAGSQIRSDARGAAYQVTATLTYTDSSGESLDVTQSLVSIPVGRNAWEAYSVTVGGALSQHTSMVDGMLTSFEPAGAVGDAMEDDAIRDTQETPSGGGCLIATAAYGSELAPQVQLLREIRDNMLLSTDSGISFMAGFNQLYYSFSPAVADLERENAAFKDAVRVAITPALYTLSIMTLADQNSDASVVAFGLLTIAAMAGIYMVGPVLAVRAISRRVRRAQRPTASATPMSVTLSSPTRP